jgi:hypothetical protein
VDSLSATTIEQPSNKQVGASWGGDSTFQASVACGNVANGVDIEGGFLEYPALCPVAVVENKHRHGDAAVVDQSAHMP